MLATPSPMTEKGYNMYQDAPSMEKNIIICIDELEKRALAQNEYIDQLKKRLERISKHAEVSAIAKERKPITHVSDLQNQIRAIDGLLEDNIDKLRFILDYLDL